jgi:transcriptional regulator with XRE-family HTH domain
MQTAVVKIGDNLKRQRIRKALTQEELARQAGLTTASVARIERNETEPRMSTLRKLAKALEIDPAELVGD